MGVEYRQRCRRGEHEALFFYVVVSTALLLDFNRCRSEAMLQRAGPSCHCRPTWLPTFRCSGLYVLYRLHCAVSDVRLVLLATCRRL